MEEIIEAFYNLWHKKWWRNKIGISNSAFVFHCWCWLTMSTVSNSHPYCISISISHLTLCTFLINPFTYILERLWNQNNDYFFLWSIGLPLLPSFSEEINNSLFICFSFSYFVNFKLEWYLQRYSDIQVRFWCLV